MLHRTKKLTGVVNQENEGGKNCDHAHDGMAVARKSLDFLDFSEF